MKINNLKLSNWRGVSTFDRSFSPGVTIIEGPNEIGKSTVVEALKNLFFVIDSSNKADIKAIQPVGLDVGSSVEAQVEIEDLHLTYGKTFNKNKKTELRVTGSSQEQLAGRPAHERVEEILKQTVDMDLWKALLWEQGQEVDGARLIQSDGLTRALDEVAGGQNVQNDDSDLYSIIMTEYEKYFTLKTNKLRASGFESDILDAQNCIDEVSAALNEVDSDRVGHERCSAEITRLESELPRLQTNIEAHQVEWDALNALKSRIEPKQKELETAEELKRSAEENQDRRLRLISELAASRTSLTEAKNEMIPFRKARQELDDERSAIELQTQALNDDLKKTKILYEASRADHEHLQLSEKLTSAKLLLSRLKQITDQKSKESAALALIKIDAAGLEQLRADERALEIKKGRLIDVASSVEIQALDTVDFDIDGSLMHLEHGMTEIRSASSELHINLPGVIDIRIKPPQAVTNLSAELREHQRHYEQLLSRFSVKNLADAVDQDSLRATHLRTLESCNEKLKELQGQGLHQDVSADVNRWEPICRAYIENRVVGDALPDSLIEAKTKLVDAEAKRDKSQELVNKNIALRTNIIDKLSKVNADYRVAEQNETGFAQACQRYESQLGDARERYPDDVLSLRVSEKTVVVNALNDEIAGLNTQLASVAPDAIEALFSNAKEAFSGAENSLQQQKEHFAVLSDRLIQAQSKDLFESLNDLNRKLEVLSEKSEAYHLRANAAKRLWQTFNIHRENARKAYLKPLKDEIEYLGRIVFGHDFTIQLDADWAITSRTMAAKTIPFGDLSVGAREQLGILTRLAAAIIASSNGGVPLIIDDAMGFSDPKRLETMGAAIAAAGKDVQIIILTCSPGRFTHVGGATTIRL